MNDYEAADFEDPDCPTTTSHRDWKDGRITAADRKRAKQSVQVQLDWARQQRRRDLDDGA